MAAMLVVWFYPVSVSLFRRWNQVRVVDHRSSLAPFGEVFLKILATLLRLQPASPLDKDLLEPFGHNRAQIMESVAIVRLCHQGSEAVFVKPVRAVVVSFLVRGRRIIDLVIIADSLILIFDLGGIVVRDTYCSEGTAWAEEKEVWSEGISHHHRMVDTHGVVDDIHHEDGLGSCRAIYAELPGVDMTGNSADVRHTSSKR
ncbi:hypothetical protein N657DRAFT_630065 [Parathielavia appendiculata]|uniref:Uncharacterized protein n=1 Tax=Parathielavia appendiculata TaxID=2587402 RepID=A0AAN6U9W8_9PEZI|nr:hypothetical protein N657DRAFT_630065 [Parathielavia appendiculata]